MKKDKVYWIVYSKVKKKHPAWTKKQCGVGTYMCLLESGNKKMKFIKVDFYDNDFGSFFLDTGDKIKEYMYRRDIEYDDYLLEKLKAIIIDMVSVSSKLFHLASYTYDYIFIRDIYGNVNPKVLFDRELDAIRDKYEKYDISDYLREIKLSIIESNIEDLEWNNGETLYIPIGDYVVDIRPFVL